jgi:hypothetical protein
MNASRKAQVVLNRSGNARQNAGFNVGAFFGRAAKVGFVLGPPILGKFGLTRCTTGVRNDGRENRGSVANCANNCVPGLMIRGTFLVDNATLGGAICLFPSPAPCVAGCMLSGPGVELLSSAPAAAQAFPTFHAGTSCNGQQANAA